MFKKKVKFVNEVEPNNHYYVLVMLLIVLTVMLYLSDYQQYQELKNDYNDAIVIYNLSVNRRSGDVVKATTPETPIEIVEITEQDTPQVDWQDVARITAYSELDSCHFPDGKGGCLNAYNETIQDRQIACPLSIGKGSKIEIEGLGEFICMDKTANWVQEEKGMTFDIWFGYGEEAHDRAWNFGEQFLKYRVI